MINVSWIGLDQSDALYVSVEKALADVQKHCSTVSSFRAVLTHSQHESPKNKVSLHAIAFGANYDASAADDNMYLAIGKAADKLESQISRASKVLR